MSWRCNDNIYKMLGAVSMGKCEVNHVGCRQAVCACAGPVPVPSRPQAGRLLGQGGRPSNE